MIIEIVTFKNREGVTCEQEYASALHAAHEWIKHPELVAKHFFRDGESGGAVYIWPSKDAALRAHNEAWRQSVIERTGGNEPNHTYYELMVSADAKGKQVIEYGPAAQAAE